MVDLGDLPEWVAAVGTVGALVGSLVLIGRQLSEWRRAAEDRRRRQAERVTAWVWEVRPSATPHPLVVLRVANSNTSAVYATTVKIDVGVSGTFWRWLGSMGPMETRELEIPLPGVPRSNLLEPDLAFTDGAGRRWLRKSGGELRDWVVSDNFESSPGAYPSIEAHPTMGINPGDKGKWVDPAVTPPARTGGTPPDSVDVRSSP